MKRTPKFDAKGAAFARFALRGCLTRLALQFQFADGKFTGPEVANVLVAAVLAVDQLGPDSLPELKVSEDGQLARKEISGEGGNQPVPESINQ